ncbi:hypothetical protein EVB61_227 [Rhizobium phage RHph_TM21B]|nr:hypothetical protein EVB61_227 [Rhizobium phage RHph_TM21B]
MMYIRYALYLPINLLLVLSAYVFSPILAALSLVTGPTLPGVLQWFSTTDDDLDGGIHQNVSGYKSGLKGFSLWWQRTCWICRNPAHGWQSNLLGMSVDGFEFIEKIDISTPKWYLMKNNKHTFFMWKKDQRLFSKYYLKLWFGWLNTAYDGKNHHYEFQIGLKSKN